MYLRGKVLANINHDYYCICPKYLIAEVDITKIQYQGGFKRKHKC
jgi:hypothetical protein